MNEKFWMRYDDLSLVPPDVLNATEPYLDRIIGYDVDDHRTELGLHRLLLNLWLKGHQPDLSTRDIRQFGDYIACRFSFLASSPHFFFMCLLYSGDTPTLYFIELGLISHKLHDLEFNSYDMMDSKPLYPTRMAVMNIA